MPRLTAAEKSDYAEHEKWREWGNIFGWKLAGSNNKYDASFYLPNDRNASFNVTDVMRDSINEALSRAGKAGL